MPNLICKHCGREFWSGKSDSMYCFNDDCYKTRMRKWRIEHGYTKATRKKKKRKKRKRYMHRICEKCGKEFITTSTTVRRCVKCREYRLPYSCPEKARKIKERKLASVPDTRQTISGDDSPTEGDNQWQKQEQTE